jgi:hypothetical protein
MKPPDKKRPSARNAEGCKKRNECKGKLPESQPSSTLFHLRRFAANVRRQKPMTNRRRVKRSRPLRNVIARLMTQIERKCRARH